METAIITTMLTCCAGIIVALINMRSAIKKSSVETNKKMILNEKTTYENKEAIESLKRRCPCDLVVNLREAIEEHRIRLAKGDVAFAQYDRDIEYIKQNTATIKSDLTYIRERIDKLS